MPSLPALEVSGWKEPKCSSFGQIISKDLPLSPHSRITMPDLVKGTPVAFLSLLRCFHYERVSQGRELSSIYSGPTIC